MLTLTKDTFEAEVEKHKGLVVIDLFATWCAPCRMLAPVLEELEKEYPDVKFCKINVDEERELAEKEEIPTDFGETLSWAYLCYVRTHPIDWRVPTRILYGTQDNLTSLETISAFAGRLGAELTVMPEGEHWFHTPEQMRFLDAWLIKA